MIRLNVVAEGHTEEGFVHQVLREHFANHSNIAMAVRRIRTNRNRKGVQKYSGGLVKYAHLKRDIGFWMCEDQNQDVRFTCMIDLYGLPVDFPGLDKVSQKMEPLKKVKILEEALRNDIGDRRFVPYIQLHEFEALLFVDPSKLLIKFPESQDAVQALEAIAKNYSSPEDINEGKETSPSKRVIAAIPEYEKEKKDAGPAIAESIGLNLIRQKCPHFNAWIEKLEALK